MALPASGRLEGRCTAAAKTVVLGCTTLQMCADVCVHVLVTNKHIVYVKPVEHDNKLCTGVNDKQLLLINGPALSLQYNGIVVKYCRHFRKNFEVVT